MEKDEHAWGHASRVLPDDETFNKEREPDGLDQHVAGAKLDAGKIRAGLVLGDFSHALTEVCKVGTYGAKKYTPHGWLFVSNGIERYTDAMLRHWLAECSGEKIDPETALYHAAQIAWNALARLELMLHIDSAYQEGKTLKD